LFEKNLDYLFIRHGAIGDVLRALPSLRAFVHERPELHAGFLTEEASLPVIQGVPEISLPLLFPRKVFSAYGPAGWIMAARWASDKRRWLRERGSPVVVDLHGTYKSALIARRLAPGRLIGFPRRQTKEPVQFLYREKIALPDPVTSRFERYHAMFKALGLTAEPMGGLPLAEKYLAAGRKLAEGAGWKMAILAVGTSKREAWKRWPAARFGELARRLKSDLGLHPLIAWGPGEEDLRDAALAASQGAAAALPSLPLMELFGALAAADLVVGADTGPLHAAALLGRPAVALFGATDAALNRPWGNSAQVVNGAPDPWRPEYRGQAKWMEMISAEQAFAACRSTT
jgi:heptosyltransferase-1